MSIPGTLVLGAVFSDLISKLKEAEEKAIGGGIVLEVGAGGELALALQQAQTAYEYSLSLTMAQLSSGDQMLVNSLASLVDTFTRSVMADLSLVEDQARGLIHDLPFSKHFPQVFSFSPRYMAPSPGVSEISFTLVGDFYDVPRPSYVPTLKLADKSFPATVKSSTLVSFSLPSSLFVPAPTKLVIVYAAIDIPYQKGVIIHKEAHSQFTLPIVVLPTTLGQVSFHVTTPTPGMIRQQVVSGPQSQISDDDDIKDGGEHADLAIHKWPADAGWTVIPSSVTYRITRSEGDEGQGKDWWFGRNLSTLSEAVLTFNTEHHRIGTSGKIWFNIVFTEEKPTHVGVASDHDINLSWGDTKVLDVPVGSTWTGKFSRFDGKVIEFAGDYTDSFLKVRQSGHAITISAIP